MIYHNQIVTCKRGFKYTKAIPTSIVEDEIEAVTLSPDGKSLFPECVECDLGTPDDCSILIMPDANGILRRAKRCVLKLHDPDEVIITRYDKVQATAEAMQRSGGGFVKYLGAALAVADSGNIARIRKAFPEYWKEYRAVAEMNSWYLGD